MRTRFCILAVLAALAVGLTVCSHRAIYAQREEVAVEQVVLQGDPARAEGVCLDLQTTLEWHLFWQTHVVAGPEIQYDTAYTYSATERRPTRESEPDGLQVDVMGDNGITDPSREQEDQYGMQKPYNDVAARCPAGTEEYTETVRLRDYYEVYPLYVQGSFSELLPSSLEINRFVIEGEADAPEQQLQELLRAYFPIPVSEDATLKIHVDKDATGEIRSFGGSGWWAFDTYSVVREGGVYFIFSPTVDEKHLDTSLFPLGYGVYFLPVELTLTETVDGYEAASPGFGDPVRVCPVDPAVEYAYLCGEEEGDLYLFTQQEGTLTLTVLDESGAAVQVLPVLEGMEEDDRLNHVRLRQGFLLAETRTDRFRVVETAGQTCRATLEGSFRELWREETLDPVYYDPVLDYDGERLALAGQSGHGLTSFLALYGEAGLEYLGTYFLSHDGELDHYYWEEDLVQSVRLPR